MDLTRVLHWWPIGVLVLLGAGVLLAAARCAVAEVFVRLSAFLYSADPTERAAKLSEWLALIERMSPAQRQENAGSWLWLALKRAPRTILGRTRATRSREALRSAAGKRPAIVREGIVRSTMLTFRRRRRSGMAAPAGTASQGESELARRLRVSPRAKRRRIQPPRTGLRAAWSDGRKAKFDSNSGKTSRKVARRLKRHRNDRVAQELSRRLGGGR